jgi:hypothetical protein
MSEIVHSIAKRVKMNPRFEIQTLKIETINLVTNYQFKMSINYPIPAPIKIERTFEMTSEYKTSFEKSELPPTRANRME